MRKWKNVKRILSFIIAIVLIGDIALGVQAKENTHEKKMEEIAVNQLIDGYKNHYRIRDAETIVLDKEVTESTITEYLYVTLYATMKEDSIEQTAYFQGMCEELDMTGEEIKSVDGVMLCATSEEDYEKAYLISQVNNEMASYSETIGIETDFNFYLKVEKELNAHKNNDDNIKVYVETFEGYAPLETVFPKGKEELYREGQNYIEEQRELYENGEISLVATVDNYSVEEKYRKLQEYVLKYTSNPSKCDCGSDCKSKQDKSKWNTAEYGYYSSLLHNDCADYISQAMYYAGITEDSSWYAQQGGTTRSTTWVNVSKLESHMTNRGVWKKVTKNEATCGDIIRYDFSHVTMITYKDANGVIKYSGHTHDRRNAVTSLPDKYTYYRVNFS